MRTLCVASNIKQHLLEVSSLFWPLVIGKLSNSDSGQKMSALKNELAAVNLTSEEQIRHGEAARLALIRYFDRVSYSVNPQEDHTLRAKLYASRKF